LRAGCGLNDSFVEVGVSEPKSLADWVLQVQDRNDDLICEYTFESDNWTWPLKVTWLDMMEDGSEVCVTFPITGTVYLRNPSDMLVDTRIYTETMAAGNSWAALVYTDTEGAWAECTPSPGGK